jgi:hypothetical protein
LCQAASSKLLEFLHQFIVLGVADFGAVEHVVAVIVVIDGLPQLFYPLPDLIDVCHKAPSIIILP